jgi:hypothetical protein
VKAQALDDLEAEIARRFATTNAAAEQPTGATKLEGILSHIERPLETIAPSAAPTARRLFARALLSAVHGVVARGLDENLGLVPAEYLSWQVRALVEAAASGVADHPEIITMAGA